MCVDGGRNTTTLHFETSARKHINQVVDPGLV